MATKQELLIEANNRGLLKGEQKARFDEAVRRGLINLPEVQEAVEGVIDEYPKMTADEYYEKYGDAPDMYDQIIPDEPKPEKTAGEKALGAAEAGLSAASGMTTGTVGMITGTLKGLIDELRSGEFGSYEAADRIEKEAMRFMDALTYSPRSEAGQEYISDIGEAGQALAPLAGLAAPTQQIAQMGRAAAPHAAQAARTGAQRAGQAARNTAVAAKPAAELVKGIFEYQSPTKQKIAQLLLEHKPDVSTAGYELKGPVKTTKGIVAPKDTSVKTGFEKLKQSLDIGGPKVKKDTIALETIKQGFDEGVIASVKAGSRQDKSKMLQMLDILEKGKKNKEYAMRNRPSDVAGNSLMDRVKAIRVTNRKAGGELEKAAQSLKKVDIDSSPAISQFMNDLDDMGINLTTDKNGKVVPDFRGSDIEGLSTTEQTVARMVDRLGRDKKPNAYELHRVKKYIDENVTYGKAGEGLSGKTERVLKRLRSNLDRILDDNFPEYDLANKKYADTIRALDALQDVAGRKMDLTASSADKTTGTLLRRLMSNAQSRVRLLDSIDDIESIAAKYGIEFDDNLMAQTLFVDELDRVFKPVARTSLQGQVQQAIESSARTATSPTGVVDMAISGAAKGAEKVRGINEDNALRAIRQLLKKQEQL